MSDPVTYAALPLVETWQATNDWRLVESMVGGPSPQRLGPILQRLWQCRETGEFRWHTMPTHQVDPAEFTQMLSQKK